jgi:hypothetical protein
VIDRKQIIAQTMFFYKSVKSPQKNPVKFRLSRFVTAAD